MRVLEVALVATMLLWSTALLPAGANAQRRSRRVPTTEQPSAEPSTSARDAEARNLYEAGRLAFDDGRFEEALTNFRRSFELSDRGELLYNIGVAADRLRRDQEALDAYEQFLVRSPETPQRRNVEARIRVLRDTVTHASQPSIGLAAIPAENGPREVSGVDQTPVPLTPTTAVARGPEVYETWWFWAIVGVVVAGGVVTGAVLAGQAPETQPLVTGDFGNVVFTLRAP